MSKYIQIISISICRSHMKESTQHWHVGIAEDFLVSRIWEKRCAYFTNRRSRLVVNLSLDNPEIPKTRVTGLVCDDSKTISLFYSFYWVNVWPCCYFQLQISIDFNRSWHRRLPLPQQSGILLVVEQLGRKSIQIVSKRCWIAKFQ